LPIGKEGSIVCGKRPWSATSAFPLGQVVL